MPGGPSDFYTTWIKQSLRENTPYDQWVREMLTAQGYVWSTPAAGYFQRDQAMPLDNMANTVQVFLGTRLECAQCHNHPFEAWTRHDFYRMAAYRHHLSTVNFHQAQWPEMQRLLDQRGASKDVRTWASRTFALLKRRVYDAERQLQLPEDYADDDAQPGQVVQPATIFGDATCGESVCDHQQAFAEWLASPHNPHFTTVITNRMWKKVMGRGLIEPVDDMNQSASASHPELLQYLETLMVENQYDLRQFQRVLYNTRTYQRAVCSRDLVEEDRYYFPGPPLKQMTAEQLWDSLMTLMAPDIDLRQGERFRALHYLRENLCGYERATPEELVDASYQAAEVRRLNNETQEKLFALEKRIAEAEKSGDADIVKQLRAEVSELEHYSNHEIPIRIDGRTWLYRTQDEYRQAKRMSLEESLPHVDSYWSAPERNWCVRAAELSSPADSDHPLRTFGQSDREQIDNASSGPTIPLALTLMNGEYFKMVHHAESMLMRNVRSARSPAETVEVLYLTLLSRFPSEDEAQVMAAAQGHAAEPQEAVEDAAWALINTREFMFVR